MLTANLESPLPPTLPTGTATALYCSGTAWADGAPVCGFELLVNGVPGPLQARAMPRFDMPVRRSGFWGVVPVRAGAAGSEVVLSGRAPGLGEVELGRIAVVPAPAPARAADGGRIAVCLATHDPDPVRLARQLESLRAQSHGRWVCVISDDCSSEERFRELGALVAGDARFTLSRSDRRLGFYRNFERALGLVPPDAGLVALCDQDDVWHPDKLSVLRSALGGALLAYSDCRIVDAEGRLLRETMWGARANNWTNLASLLIANTVTGAASLMRREVIERALPFPDAPGLEFHDHWLALVALSCGEVVYVERPLYDYVQHHAAVLGGAPGRGRPPGGVRPRALRAAYFVGYLPGAVRAEAVRQRCGERLSARKRRALSWYRRAERSPLALLWLLLRPLVRRETLGSEWELVPGLVWAALARALAAVPGWPERLLLDTRLPDEGSFEQRRLGRWRRSI